MQAAGAVDRGGGGADGAAGAAPRGGPSAHGAAGARAGDGGGGAAGGLSGAGGCHVSSTGERIEQQHCEDFSLWSDELLRSREKAAEELGLLREDMQRQDQLWHQEWTRMQQDASRQGIDVADPPGVGSCPAGFLQLEEAQEPRDDPEKPGPNGWTESLEGRATLATIPEAESEEVQAQTPGGKSAARSPEQPKAQVPSPTSRSSSSPSSVPEDDLMKGLEKASDDKQASRAWARIGQFHQRQKSFDQARQAYQSAVRLDNSQHGCLANLAQLEAHAGHVSTAKERCWPRPCASSPPTRTTSPSAAG
ncbi:unnamed protein product [Effrenium voratum]|nr:unnamed protein product [Effrenium voratum]